MEEQLQWKIEKSKMIIKQAFERFKNLGLVASGGKDSTVMLDLVMKVVRENNFEQPWVLLSDPVPFEENEEFCKKLAEHYKLEKPLFYRQFSDKYLNSEEFKKKVGEPGKDKKMCCYLLKVKPLQDFIKEYKIDGLFVAIRWDEHPERAKEVYFSPREDHMRIHPMLHWSWLDIWLYIKEKNVPFNPLYLKGYTSLGCKPCTSVVKPEGFKNVDEIIEFIKAKKVHERAGRDIDKERIMESLRRLGYF